MLRPVIAFMLSIIPTAAFATDWRFAVDAADGSSVTYVDLDSIAPRDGAARTVSTYTVDRDGQKDFSASVVQLRIDCRGRRMSIFRIITFDEQDRQLQDLSGTRPWAGPFPQGTQGGGMVDYICSNGGSDPGNPSLGAERPHEDAIRRLREQSE